MEQINEELARRAKDANSFSEYVEGSATAGYNEKCKRGKLPLDNDLRRREFPRQKEAEAELAPGHPYARV